MVVSTGVTRFNNNYIIQKTNVIGADTNVVQYVQSIRVANLLQLSLVL
jgi:hypothetical protein